MQSNHAKLHQLFCRVKQPAHPPVKVLSMTPDPTFQAKAEAEAKKAAEEAEKAAQAALEEAQAQGLPPPVLPYSSLFIFSR